MLVHVATFSNEKKKKTAPTFRLSGFSDLCFTEQVLILHHSRSIWHLKHFLAVTSHLMFCSQCNVWTQSGPTSRRVTAIQLEDKPAFHIQHNPPDDWLTRVKTFIRSVWKCFRTAFLNWWVAALWTVSLFKKGPFEVRGVPKKCIHTSWWHCS